MFRQPAPVIWLLKTVTTATLVWFVVIYSKPTLFGQALAISGAIINLFHYRLLKSTNGDLLTAECLFGRIRHPMYLGELMLCGGLVTLTYHNTAPLLLLLQTLLILRLVACEDADLERKFGQPFQDWKQRTKRLIPYVY